MSNLLCSRGMSHSYSEEDKENAGCLPRKGSANTRIMMGKGALAYKSGEDLSVKKPLGNNNGDATSKSLAIPEYNTDVQWMDSHTVVLKRGRLGFGFSVTGSSPTRISSVKPGTSAEQAGLQRGDYIVKLNGQNVSRSMADSVANIIRYSEKQIVMDIHRSDSAMSLVTEMDETASQLSWQPGHSSTCQSSSLRSHQSGSSGFMKGKEISASTLSLHTALPKIDMSLQSLGCQRREQQMAVEKLYNLEAEFVRHLDSGIHHYVQPLRDCSVSPSEHATLFQNMEQLASFSEHHLVRIRDMSALQDDMAAGSVYRPWVESMGDAYESYCNGVKNAFRLLLELSEDVEFKQLLKELSATARGLSISQFLQKPLQHMKNLVLCFQDIAMNTALEHYDYQPLKEVIETLKAACNRINESNTRKSSSTLSLSSRSSEGSRSPQPPKSLNESRSHSEHSSRGSDASMPSQHSASSQKSRSSKQSRSSQNTRSSSDQSMVSIASVDSEVMDIQTRLILPDHMPAVQIATATRHMIYAGDLFYFDGLLWKKLYVVLLSDLILITQPDQEGYLTLWEEPIILHNVTQVNCEGIHECEFILGLKPGSITGDRPTLTLQAPTPELKATWTNLLQQRISSFKSQMVSNTTMDNVV